MSLALQTLVKVRCLRLTLVPEIVISYCHCTCFIHLFPSRTSLIGFKKNLENKKGMSSGKPKDVKLKIMEVSQVRFGAAT